MPELFGDLTGYVLAGGRSSRMGTGKAELRLDGRTLLEIACAKLLPICREVVVVGALTPPQGVRSIRDLHPGCGPIGGMEAALRDLPSAFAAFLPVDMPLLPAALLAELTGWWSSPACRAARVCFAIADGNAQPLVSRVHREVLPALSEAISAGELKLRPVLERAAAQLGKGALERTDIATGQITAGQITGGQITSGKVCVGVGHRGNGWSPSPSEREISSLWFSNLNTPEEFQMAEDRVGSRSAL